MTKTAETTVEDLSAGKDEDMHHLYNQLIYLKDLLRKRALEPAERAKELGAMEVLAFGLYRVNIKDNPEVEEELIAALTEFYNTHQARCMPDVALIQPILDKLSSDKKILRNQANFASSASSMIGGAISFDIRMAKYPEKTKERVVWLENNKKLHSWRLIKGL